MKVGVGCGGAGRQRSRRPTRGQGGSASRGAPLGASNKAPREAQTRPLRKRHVLVCLLGGERVSSIAADLFVSQSTVRGHLSAIFSKMSGGSRAELTFLIRSVKPQTVE